MTKTEILKQHLLDYIHALSIYDYIAYGWLFAILCFLLFIAIALIGKKPIRALTLIVLTMILMLIAPFGLKLFLDKTIRHAIIVDQNSTKLHFTPDLIVTGKVQNKGYVDFRTCRVRAKIFKKDTNRIKDTINRLKPLRQKTILLKKRLQQEAMEEFKIVFNRFDYPGAYRVQISAECY